MAHRAKASSAIVSSVGRFDEFPQPQCSFRPLMIFLKQKNCCRVDLRVYMHTRPAGLTDGLEKKKKIRNWNAIVWQ
jgi:hypothetical protein